MNLVQYYFRWETLFERNVEYAWSDKDSVANIHLNECSGFKHMFNIAQLAQSLLAADWMQFNNFWEKLINLKKFGFK